MTRISQFKSIKLISIFTKGILLLILCLSKPILSQNNDLQLIHASDGFNNSWYGKSISLSDDYLVVGSIASLNSNSVTHGACYVYTKDINGNWGNEQKIIYPGNDTHSLFGSSVSISGNTIVVGAVFEVAQIGGTGAAYVYEVDGNGQWNFKQKLIPIDTAPNLKFGNNVFISEGYMAVQSEGNFFLNQPSIVTIFEKGNDGFWSEVQKIEPLGANESQTFGIDLCIYGDYLVVGNSQYSDIATYQGAVHIYQRDGNGMWINETTLSPNNDLEYFSFGQSVSMYENTLMVGAPSLFNFIDYPGLVYVYELNGTGNWNIDQVLNAPNTEEYDGFGADVKVHKNQLIVGGQNHIPNSPPSGYAHYFLKTGNSDWIHEEMYLPVDVNTSQRFGYNVAISESALAIADENNALDGNYAGAVFVKNIYCSFTLDCPEDLTIKTNTASCEGLIAFEEAAFNPVIIEGCGDITLSQTAGPLLDELAELGSYELSFEAVSEEGASAECSFILEVVDEEAPIASCQDLELLIKPCEELTISTEEIDFGSTDACGIDSYNLSQTTFDESHIGTNPVELTVIDINGNSSTCNANVLINPAINIDESRLIEAENITVTYGDRVDLIPSIDNQDWLIFSWYVDGTLYCEDCYSISISPESNVLVELLVLDAADCFTLSDAVNIQLLVDYSVHIPTAFSPNYDGANDLFQAYFSDGVERAYELQVRDRWGNILYHKKGEQTGWDGRFRGEEANVGVYSYTLVFSLVNGEEVVETGDVCLVR